MTGLLIKGSGDRGNAMSRVVESGPEARLEARLTANIPRGSDSLRIQPPRFYVGEPESDLRLPLPTRLRLILGLAVASWILFGLAAYAVVEILFR
jgi:hypothetical protein